MANERRFDLHHRRKIIDFAGGSAQLTRLLAAMAHRWFIATNALKRALKE
jgi:hypothetical protein